MHNMYNMYMYMCSRLHGALRLSIQRAGAMEIVDTMAGVCSVPGAALAQTIVYPTHDSHRNGPDLRASAEPVPLSLMPPIHMPMRCRRL